jgi:CBS domain containing-hemolysin-like protein
MKLLNWLNDVDTPEIVEEQQGSLNPVLRQKLEELSHVPVTKVMIPRPLIQGLDADIQLRRVKRLKSSKIRYFPVYKGDLDRILGWIEKSKVVELLNNDGRDDTKLENHLQSIAKIPDTATVNMLADVFLHSKSPIIVVTNEAGQTVGLMTLVYFVELLFGFELDGLPPSPPQPDVSAKTYEI